MMPPPADRLPRFTRAERYVHRVTAWLVLVLTVTGATLYDESLALLVGRRAWVEGTHIAAGLLLAVPTLVGLALSPAFRADVRLLGRWTRSDLDWLRRKDRRLAGLPTGKFNGGQKLASALVAGAGIVLLATGVLLIAPARVDLPVAVRQGATITHDLFTFAVLALLAGHILLAYRHPEARAALRTGLVDRGYAEREHAAWAAVAGPPATAPATNRRSPDGQ
jgi:formate dehydrogenase subunit gamma